MGNVFDGIEIQLTSDCSNIDTALQPILEHARPEIRCYGRLLRAVLPEALSWQTAELNDASGVTRSHLSAISNATVTMLMSLIANSIDEKQRFKAFMALTEMLVEALSSALDEMRKTDPEASQSKDDVVGAWSVPEKGEVGRVGYCQSSTFDGAMAGLLKAKPDDPLPLRAIDAIMSQMHKVMKEFMDQHPQHLFSDDVWMQLAGNVAASVGLTLLANNVDHDQRAEAFSEMSEHIDKVIGKAIDVVTLEKTQPASVAMN